MRCLETMIILNPSTVPSWWDEGDFLYKLCEGLQEVQCSLVSLACSLWFWSGLHHKSMEGKQNPAALKVHHDSMSLENFENILLQFLKICIISTIDSSIIRSQCKLYQDCEVFYSISRKKLVSKYVAKCHEYLRSCNEVKSSKYIINRFERLWLVEHDPIRGNCHMQYELCEHPKHGRCYSASLKHNQISCYSVEFSNCRKMYRRE